MASKSGTGSESAGKSPLSKVRPTSGCLLEDLESQNNKQSNSPVAGGTMDLAAPEVVEVGAAIGAASNVSPNKQKTGLTHVTADVVEPDTDMSAVSTLSVGDICKICHCGAENNAELIAPCFCSGSLKYVHQECLQRWIKSSDIRRCELCKYPFTMQAKVSTFEF